MNEDLKVTLNSGKTELVITQIKDNIIRINAFGVASGKHGQWSDTDKKTAENFGIDYMDVEDFINVKFEE